MIVDSWFGLNHSAINEKFEGDLTFIAEFEIDGNPFAVYYSANPDRSKGHKDFMTLSLFTDRDGNRRALVSGLNSDEMEKHRYQTGVLCKSCGTILYSRANHDYRTCRCENKTMVDGGRSSLRIGGKDFSLVETIQIDHLAVIKTIQV